MAGIEERDKPAIRKVLKYLSLIRYEGEGFGSIEVVIQNYEIHSVSGKSIEKNDLTTA